MAESQLIEFMVMKIEDGKYEGLGQHGFRIPPRVGEFVGFNDEKGIGLSYRVVAVLHPLSPVDTAGDLILEYVGTDTEMRNSFLGKS